jgi:hypothetical protein
MKVYGVMCEGEIIAAFGYEHAANRLITILEEPASIIEIPYFEGQEVEGILTLVKRLGVK